MALGGLLGGSDAILSIKTTAGSDKLLVLRVEGRVFFLNAARIGERIRLLINQAKPRVVAIDLSGVFDLEYTALKALHEARKRLDDDGVAIWLVGLSPAVLRVVERSLLAEQLGRERMHFNLEIAVEKYMSSKPNEVRTPQAESV